MENSDSDEEDGSVARSRSQMDRLVREENFYEFVNNLSEEDYKLMRDNDLLGIPGESTLEELLKRLQQIKENPPENSEENTGGGESFDSSGEYLLDWLNTFGQTEYVTSGQRENQSWEEIIQINSDSNDSTFSLEVNSNPNNGSPNPENEYVASTRSPRTYNMENSQSQAENTQSESTFIRSPGSEQSTTEALIQVPVTRGRRRERSSSPDHRRTRARTESSPAPNRMSELLRRLHYSITSPTFEQPLVNETERFSRIQHQETSRQQITGPELQNSGLAATSGSSSALQEENSPGTTNDGESQGLGQINPTIQFNCEVGQVHPRADSQRDSTVTRIQLTSETPNNALTLESEQGGRRDMFPHSEQADARAYVRNARIPSLHIILTTGFNDIPPPAIQSTLRQTVTGSSGLSGNLRASDTDLVHSVSPLSPNMEREESRNERDASDVRTHSDCNSNPSSDFHSSSPLISRSGSNYLSSSNSTPISSSSSSDEYSEISSVMFEDSNDISLPPGSSSETRRENRSMSPIVFDDSDSWTSLNLDHFFLLNEDDHDQHTGLTKAQIDNLAIRSFREGGVLKACTICITEYTEGNKLRILPCTHEFHVHCIDRWLSENSTCPICRREVAGSAERENSN
ncbi:E3 ubiquitin-protein ligase RLIM-like [Leopardus geoffroyi]|uniref:E3 ubiquitin-protein ligase RLIM-like n=1 Tax=Leopardus geoffroyi TaxID=46844 RepID=UPI001E25F22A|nr:E3 ubiquitin-protein ligase RLIM-like [Leopardus geoffroyi]